MDSANEKYEQTACIFVVSVSRTFGEHVYQVARELCKQVPVINVDDSFPSDYSASMGGCILLAVDRYDSSTLATLNGILGVNAQAQVIVIVNAVDWRVSDVVQAIHAGFVDFLDAATFQDRLGDALQMAFKRDQKNRALASAQIPDILQKDLSSEEARIFSLLVQGKTAKQVSSELDLSIRTVHYRKKTIFKKLGVCNRNEAFELIRRIQLQDSKHMARPHLFAPLQSQACSQSANCFVP